MSHEATNWAIKQRGLKPTSQDRALASLRPVQPGLRLLSLAGAAGA